MSDMFVINVHEMTGPVIHLRRRTLFTRSNSRRRHLMIHNPPPILSRQVGDGYRGPYRKLPDTFAINVHEMTGPVIHLRRRTLYFSRSAAATAVAVI
jgi:hypothetical protein